MNVDNSWLSFDAPGYVICYEPLVCEPVRIAFIGKRDVVAIDADHTKWRFNINKMTRTAKGATNRLVPQDDPDARIIRRRLAVRAKLREAIEQIEMAYYSEDAGEVDSRIDNAMDFLQDALDASQDRFYRDRFYR